MPVVAAIAPLIIALVALIALWGLYTLLRPMLVALLRRIPLIGGELSLLADAIITDAYNYGLAQAKRLARDVLGWVMAPVHWIASLIESISGTLQDIYTAIYNLRYIIIPRLINTALGTVQGWVNSANAFSYKLFQAGVTYTLTQITALTAWTRAQIGAVTSYAQGLFHQAIAYAQAGLNAANAYATSLFHQAIAYTQQESATLAAYTQTLFHQAIAYTGAQVTDLENWAEARFNTLQAWVGAEVGALSRAIALARADSFAFTAAAVGAVEADLSKLKTDCTDNLCGGLSDLATLFNALTSILDDAAIAGLVYEFAHDPAAAARNAVDELSSFTTTVIDTVKSGAGI
jgi:hypothetical protein